MSLSGETILTSSGSDLTLAAQQVLAMYGADITTLTDFDYTMSIKFLNMYMKHTQVFNGFMWKRSQGFLFLNGTNLSYTISSDDSVGWHIAEEYNTTTLSIAMADGDSTLTVDSTAGMADLDFILIPKSDLTYHSTTIAVTSDTTLTLNDPIDEDIASGARIFTYVDKIDKPMRIYSMARRVYSSSGTFQDIPMEAETFDDYLTKISSKTSTNMPIKWAYTPLRVTGQLYLIGVPQSLGDVLVFSFQKQIEHITALNIEPDYPSEWFLPLVYKLAYYLSFALELSREDKDLLKAEADRLFADTLNGDIENAPLRISNSRM